MSAGSMVPTSHREPILSTRTRTAPASVPTRKVTEVGFAPVSETSTGSGAEVTLLAGTRRGSVYDSGPARYTVMYGWSWAYQIRCGTSGRAHKETNSAAIARVTAGMVTTTPRDVAERLGRRV